MSLRPAPQHLDEMGVGSSGRLSEVYGLCAGTEVADFNYAGALVESQKSLRLCVFEAAVC